jgi:hypothetical protein
MYKLLNPEISPKILEVHHVDLKRWGLRLLPSNLTESQTIFYKNLKEWIDGFIQFEDKFVWRTSKNGTDYHFADVPQMENELMEHENTVKEYITFFRKYNIIEEVKAFVLKCEEPLKVDFLMIIIDDFKRFLVGFEEDVSHKRFAEIGSYAPHGKNIVSYELNNMVMALSYFSTNAIRDIEKVVPLYSVPLSTSEPIILNYGTNNDKIIKILHEELNTNLIESIDFNDFERHFKENDTELKKIQWTGTRPEIIRLFTGLPKSPNIDIRDLQGIKLCSDVEGYDQIINHFFYINRKKELSNFDYNTLTSKKSKETNKNNTLRIHTILEKIRVALS